MPQHASAGLPKDQQQGPCYACTAARQHGSTTARRTAARIHECMCPTGAPMPPPSLPTHPPIHPLTRRHCPEATLRLDAPPAQQNLALMLHYAAHHHARVLIINVAALRALVPPGAALLKRQLNRAAAHPAKVEQLARLGRRDYCCRCCCCCFCCCCR